MSKIHTLTDLFALVLENPNLAKHLKAEPHTIAEMFGIHLSQEEVEKIRVNLDIDAIEATQLDSMADKVAQGIGLKDLRS